MSLNILIDSLPKAYEVDGREYLLNTDFRTGILYEQLMQDPDIDSTDKVLLAARLYYPDEMPDDMNVAMNGIVWFYSCGKELVEFAKPVDGRVSRFHGKRLYDYDIDAPYFYAAFLSQYGIDLQDIEYLHWWKFQAMFLGLSDEHPLSKIMEYRGADLSKIKNKAEKERYKNLQMRYRLPDIRSKKEKQNDIGAMFGVFAP